MTLSAHRYYKILFNNFHPYITHCGYFWYKILLRHKFHINIHNFDVEESWLQTSQQFLLIAAFFSQFVSLLRSCVQVCSIMCSHSSHSEISMRTDDLSPLVKLTYIQGTYKCINSSEQNSACITLPFYSRNCTFQHILQE